MDYAITKRAPCSVCGLDSFRHARWFLVVENRWLDRLKILSWHASLATQKDMKSVCCRQHLKSLIAHWLCEGNLSVAPVHYLPKPLGSDASLADFDLGPHSAGRLVGELAVHRDSCSRGWSGSAAALECIVDALISNAAGNKSPALECQLFTPPNESSHGLSLQ